MTRFALDARFLAWSVLAAAGSLVAFGIVSAIIPNPLFGRQIAAEPFAIAVWIASAPLMGVLAATYLAPARPTGQPTPLPTDAADDPDEHRRSLIGTLGGLGAFLAIGCPVCNKVALVLLGTSGALNVWAPIQPLLGAASLGLLTVTLAWQLRVRARGGACAVRPAS